MSDEDLRVLARLAKTGDASAVLRYVHALDRVGRVFDALSALSAARNQPEVLVEIRRRAGPMRGAPIGFAWSPGPAITRTPRLRWSRALDLRGAWGVEAFAGNPFGVVLVVARNDRQAKWLRCVLDPETGEFRDEPKRFEASGVEVAVVDDTAVCRIRRGRQERRLTSIDLLTGRELWDVSDVAGGLDSAINAPRTPPLENRAVAERPLMPESRFRWVGHEGHGSHLAYGDSEAVIWRTDYPAFGVWEAADFAVVHAAEGPMSRDLVTALVIVDAKGETGRLALGTDIPSSLAFADRTIYTVISRRSSRTASLVAFDTAGRVVWEHVLDPSRGAPQNLLALPSRLVCIAGNHDTPEILCFDQPPVAPVDSSST